jgi:hypothetical protein
MTSIPRHRLLLTLAAVLVLAASLGCAEIILGDDNDSNDDGSVTGPSGTGDGTGNGNGSNGLPIGYYMVEYRVTGNATSATIRFRTADDGFNQVITALPFSASVQTNKDSILLFLEATATSFTGTPFLNAQIFVDGFIFREAFTNSIGIPVTLNATYRKPAIGATVTE